MIGATVSVVVMALGVDLLQQTEPSVKWLGFLAIVGGFVVATRSSAALSLHAEQNSGQKPSWHIENVAVGIKAMQNIQQRSPL